MRVRERLAALDEWVLSLGHRRVPVVRTPSPTWSRWWLFGTVGAVASIVGGLSFGKPLTMVMLAAAVWLVFGLPLGWVRWGPRR